MLLLWIALYSVVTVLGLLLGLDLTRTFAIALVLTCLIVAANPNERLRH